VTCPLTHHAAGYVLGALSLAERLEFERHLGGCDRCTSALIRVAGLPGLLGRVDASLLQDLPAEGPVPASLLPALTREVRRARRRHTLAVAGLATAVLVVAVIAPLVLWLAADRGGETPTRPGSTPTSSALVTHDMEPVGDVPVRASLTLEPVAWGTRLGVTCSYDPEPVEYGTPAAVRYTLVVRTRDAGADQVGSWTAEGGRTMRLSAATGEALSDIESVEVRAGPDGRVVLRLVL
jgi:hypothetical protein